MVRKTSKKVSIEISPETGKAIILAFSSMDDAATTINGPKYYSALWEMYNKLRGNVKYLDESDAIEKMSMEELKEKVYARHEEFYQLFWDILREEGIDLFEIP